LHQPGCWTLACAGESIDSPIAATPRTRALFSHLVNVLPAPAPEVGMRAIVEFRRAHSAQLLDLRGCLDEHHKTLMEHAGSELTYRGTLQRLDYALAELWKVSARQRRLRFIPTSLTTVYDVIAGGVLGGEASEIAGRVLDIDMPAALTAAAAATGATFGYAKSLWKDAASPKGVPGPFAYLYSAAEEGIIARQEI
jgi:hypothetical protein